MTRLTKDHKRVTPEGKFLGKQLAKMAEIGVKILINSDEHDTRCASCAYRLGTVPNGCAQTQLDALKCTMEGVPFFCHVPPIQNYCHGWFATRVLLRQTVGVDFFKEFTKDICFSEEEK